MALRTKDKRPHQPTYEQSSPTIHKKKKIPLVGITHRSDHFPPLSGSVDRLHQNYHNHSHKSYDSSPLSSVSRTRNQVFLVTCDSHTKEIIKFIDVSTMEFTPNCEMCIVDSNTNFKQMKLERITELHSNMKQLLTQQLENLKALDHRIDLISKEIKISNALVQPVISKIEFMEKQAYTQLENLFKKLKQKFIKNNPFRNAKNAVEDRIEEIEQKLAEVGYTDEGGYNAFIDFLKNETRWKEEMKNFMLQQNNKLENIKTAFTPNQKEVGTMENAFDGFYKNLLSSCDRFLHIALKD